MEGIDWKGRSKKWGFGIDPKNSTKDELEEYIQTKIYEYTQYKMGDEDLWDLFTDDFKGFTAEIFGRIRRQDQLSLRSYLRCGGVYVAPCNKPPINRTLAQTLVDVIEEGIQHVWTQTDIDEVKTNLEKGPITSVWISPQGDRRLNPSAKPLPQTPTLLPPNSPNPETNLQASSSAKLISEVAKIYTNEQRYDGSNGSFDYKLTIFLDICQRVDLPKEALMRAFPTMLKGLAQDHFYNNQLSNRTFDETCTNLRNFFEGPGYHRRNLDKWNSVTLASITSENPDKSTYEVVQLLINTLRQLQYGLTPALRSMEFLYNKLVTACQGSPACRYAVSDPPLDFGELINKLQSSITTYEKERDTENNIYFTDRRYYSRNQSSNRRNGYEGRRYNPSRNHDHDRRRNTCFICKKEDCRSWKHTQQEQDKSRTRFKSRHLDRFDTNVRDFDQRFESAYKQYVTEIEGDSDDTDIEDDLGNAFEALLVNTDEPALPTPLDPSTSFFTSVERLLTGPVHYAETLVYDLNNQALVHQLTTQSPSEPEEVADNLTTGDTSRYGSYCFYGIVIDTGASKYSTAGFGQFQALRRTDDNVKLNETTKGQVTVQFGIGSTSSIGSTIVETPIGQVEFHIIMAKTPFLLSLADMDKLGVYFNNLSNVMVTPNSDVPVVRRFGHSFLLWNASLQSFISESFDYNPCFLTNVELQRLHRRFGHPSTSRLQKVLERAGHDVDKATVDYLTKYCKHCQQYSQSPGRFKFNLKDDVNFNYSIIVDVFYINGNPVLYIVDEGTRYQASK
jgi:hypothetical protein